MHTQTNVHTNSKRKRLNDISPKEENDGAKRRKRFKIREDAFASTNNDEQDVILLDPRQITRNRILNHTYLTKKL